MCGRIVLSSDPDRLARILDAQLAAELDTGCWRPSWNVGPTSTLLGASDLPGGVRNLAPYRWGLVPMWAKDPGALKSTFNARAETLTTKPSFQSAFERGRILIPVDAFYEWRTVGDARMPRVFRRADGEPIVVAGLAEQWKGPDGSILHSATIVTTQAGPDMIGTHTRMPVVLERRSWDRWLDPGVADRDLLMRLLRPAGAGTLVHHPVDPAVGNVRNDGPELVDEITVGRAAV